MVPAEVAISIKLYKNLMWLILCFEEVATAGMRAKKPHFTRVWAAIFSSMCRGGIYRDKSLLNDERAMVIAVTLLFSDGCFCLGCGFFTGPGCLYHEGYTGRAHQG